MRHPLKLLITVAILLALPIVPLVIWGEMFTSDVEHWQGAEVNNWLLASILAGILAADIVLPVPSGPVSTLAGARLGAVWGTAACTLGMTAGGVIAFALARRFGRPLAERFADAADLDRLERQSRQHDLWLLLATRPLPILAEACVLVLGLLKMPWRRFLTGLFVSNLAIAATYCLLGQYAAEREWLVAAVCLSLAVPVLLALWARNALSPPAADD